MNSNEAKLIRLLESQIADLIMMSKIELGDDVITEIIRLKELLKKEATPQEKQLQKWERVNQCETVKELEACILDFADVNGMIQGRTRLFNAENMVRGLRLYMKDASAPNLITREFGLRQQAMYIKHS
jgi:hypothetical protein